VLTNSKGFTLYSFALDTPTKSNCNGRCAQNWPPVQGPAAASGVKGTFGTIKRSDGSAQATFDGHRRMTLCRSPRRFLSGRHGRSSSSSRAQARAVPS